MKKNLPSIGELKSYKIDDSNTIEIIPHHIRDTFKGKAGVQYNEFEFFNVPAGIDGKTRFHTNMDFSNKLPTTKSFLITGFRVECHNPFIKYCHYQLILNDKEYSQDKVINAYNNPITNSEDLTIIIPCDGKFSVIIHSDIPIKLNYDFEIEVTIIGNLYRYTI